MFSCPELTSHEAMVDGRLNKSISSVPHIRSQEIFMHFLCFLKAYLIPCLFVTKTALQAIDATPQEKSNSKITPLNMIMRMIMRMIIMTIILVITIMMKENSNVVLPPWQPSRWG